MVLLLLKFSRLWDFDHDERVDLVDEGDASSPDPMHGRELALYIHDKMRISSDKWEAMV